MAEAKSKFEENLIKKMDAEKDQDSIAKRAFRKAESVLKQQIAALEGKRVNLEIEAEEKAEALNDATYSAEFTLGKYDAAKVNVDFVQESLADIDKTIDGVTNLIKENTGEISDIDRWGKRHLAYPINKKKDAYYYIIYNFNF